MDKADGLERLIVVHANDSKKPLGSNVDRHENIGQGFIGEEAFARILTHSALEHLPFILEVPGIEGNGPTWRTSWRCGGWQGAHSSLLCRNFDCLRGEYMKKNC